MAGELNGYYSAILIVGGWTGADDHDPTYEERVVLVRAASKKEAEERVRADVRHSYKNRCGETVTWEVVEVVEVAELLDDRLQDVTEILGRFFFDLNAYRKFWSSESDG